MGLQSEGLQSAKLQLKYEYQLTVLKKSGVKPQKIPFCSITLSGIETELSMGNSESLEQYRPYISLLKQVLKAEGTKISEGQVLDLLQTIEKHCSWFPSLGILDLGPWKKIGSELEKLLCKGLPLPLSIWSTWTLIKSILETFQTPESSGGSEDECESPLEGGPEYASQRG